jgi:type 1 glutamine amidotransferase
MVAMRPLCFCLLPLVALLGADPWVTYRGGKGPGRHQQIVLVSGDEEYRSEEVLPQLARILATHHGFDCTVLFAIDPAGGTINPNRNDNIPGLELLAKARLMVLFTRFRDLPDDQMKHFAGYVDSGRPIVALRTATHAFAFKKHTAYQRWGWNSKEWDGGFGRQILGETWVSHHGAHGKQSTRGVIVKGQEKHPVLRGISDGGIWGPTDVYTVRLPLAAGIQPLVLGQVLEGMKPDDAPLAGPKNDPMMPVAWTKTYASAAGTTGRVFTTTMGSAEDLSSEGFRRLLVNACYWALGMEGKIPKKSGVGLVGNYQPSPFKSNGYRKGVRPADLALP